jgi:hypothetical protein
VTTTGHPDAMPLPRVRDDVILRPLDDDWVAYDPQTQQLHVLNPTAALVWVHCTGEFTRSAVIAAFREAYGDRVAEDQLVRDINAAVAEFRRLGLFV